MRLLLLEFFFLLRYLGLDNNRRRRHRDVIPEIKTVPEIIVHDDETFNLLERVSSIDYAPGEMGVVIEVGVLAPGYSLHPSFIHDIIISIFDFLHTFFRYSSA